MLALGNVGVSQCSREIANRQIVPRKINHYRSVCAQTASTRRSNQILRSNNLTYKVVNFEDFQKLDLRVVKIIEAEKVEDSSKLVKLKVDLGQEIRQIIAGIGNSYKPDQLISKNIVIVANLEPIELLGNESQGMLLAAHDSSNRPVLLVPEDIVNPGSKVS